MAYKRIEVTIYITKGAPSFREPTLKSFAIKRACYGEICGWWPPRKFLRQRVSKEEMYWKSLWWFVKLINNLEVVLSTYFQPEEGSRHCRWYQSWPTIVIVPMDGRALDNHSVGQSYWDGLLVKRTCKSSKTQCFLSGGDCSTLSVT